MTNQQPDLSNKPKLLKKLTLSPIEFTKFQLHQIINVPAQVLNNTEITILAYVHLYGKDARRKCIVERIITSENSFRNYITKFRNYGYMPRTEKKATQTSPAPMVLNPELRIVETDFVLITQVIKDEQNVKVYNSYYKPEGK